MSMRFAIKRKIYDWGGGGNLGLFAFRYQNVRGIRNSIHCSVVSEIYTLGSCLSGTEELLENF